MPIKEEPVRIEFQYEPDDAASSDSVFNIEYFVQKVEGDEKKFLKISQYGSDEPSIFEVDLLVEIVDFLRSKGVIANSIEPCPADTVATSSLPLPKIQLAGDSPAGIFSPPPPQTGVYQQSPTPNGVVGFEEGNISAGQAVSQILRTPVVKKDGPTVITAAPGAPTPVINRPVIKTRVAENEDPIKALEDSKRLRGGINAQKKIKRSEDSGEI